MELLGAQSSPGTSVLGGKAWGDLETGLQGPQPESSSFSVDRGEGNQKGTGRDPEIQCSP